MNIGAVLVLSVAQLNASFFEFLFVVLSEERKVVVDWGFSRRRSFLFL